MQNKKDMLFDAQGAAISERRCTCNCELQQVDYEVPNQRDGYDVESVITHRYFTCDYCLDLYMVDYKKKGYDVESFYYMLSVMEYQTAEGDKSRAYKYWKSSCSSPINGASCELPASYLKEQMRRNFELMITPIHDLEAEDLPF